MFDLPHVAARLYGVPLLVSARKLDTILTAVGPRLLSGASVQALEVDAPKPEAAVSRYATASTRAGTPITEGGLAVIPAYGSLVRRGAFLDALSGLTSYADIEDRVRQAMADPQVRGALLELDSFGGEAGGVFDLVDSLRAIRQEAGKPLWAIADEAACSAAYAIACAADEIWLTRTAEVGSIGVVAAHVDQSGADAKAGLAWTYIFAGAHKVDGNSHQPLPEGVAADLQADIDGLYGMFVDLVAEARGLSAEAVRATEAAVYRGAEAVAVGLADDVGTTADALDALARTLDTGLPRVRATGGRAAANPKRMEPMAEQATTGAEETTTAPAPGTGNDTQSGTDTTSGTDTQTGTDSVAGSAGADALTGAPAADALAGVAERAAQISEIAARAARLGVTVDAAKAIREGVEPAALNATVLEQLAAKADAAGVVSTASSTPADGANATAKQGWETAFSRTSEPAQAAGGWGAAFNRK